MRPARRRGRRRASGPARGSRARRCDGRRPRADCGAAEHPQEAGLPRAVAADEADLVAGAHGEAHVLHQETAGHLDREPPHRRGLHAGDVRSLLGLCAICDRLDQRAAATSAAACSEDHGLGAGLSRAQRIANGFDNPLDLFRGLRCRKRRSATCSRSPPKLVGTPADALRVREGRTCDNRMKI